MSDEHWSAVYDSARTVRVNALRPFGFTERQARFLVTVMAHSGSFLERQYCAFAGIARGQNSREFVARLVARGYATAITHGSVRRGRIYHVHHKPLYEAIGLPDDRHRKPQTVGRMVQRLMILDGVLADRNCWWMGSACDKRSYFATTKKTGLSAAEYPQLTYCRLNKGRVNFVVVFNLTRFARDKYDHFALRSHLQSLGISLRSATEPIDDTSTGKPMEGVLAAFAQFDNDVRSDRTRAGMKAALELGRWVFLAPIGYLNAPRSMGMSLMHDPERAPLVRRAFEDYATGQYTKEQLLNRARTLGLTNRRGNPLTSQAIGVLLRNQLYAGIVDVPEYGVRAKRGDFEPLISEDLFYRVQAILSGRAPSTAPRKRAHPDSPLRGFVRCETCGRGLTGSWSKGRSEYYAYYHCRPGCRAVNVTKATLEGLFADELALLQPTPGYMRLLKESVLRIWKARKAAVRDEIATAERAAKAIQEKLDRLDEAFLFERSIDIETYDRHAEKLREELTLARIDRHSGQLEELNVEGILAFAESVLPRASDLWVQASLDQRQRFQQLFFPDGIAFDGNRFIGTGATAPAFSYLREIETVNEGVVDLTGIEPITVRRG